MSDNYKELIEYAVTDRQKEILETLSDGLTITDTGEAHEISRQAIQNVIRAVKIKARQRGYDPERDLTRPVGEGMGIKRVSTNYDKKGDIAQQWVIQEPGKEEQGQRMMAFCKGLQDQFTPAKPTNYTHPRQMNTDVKACIQIGDAHLGMYAEKTDDYGEDFNIDIATADLRMAIDYLVDIAPYAEEGMLVNVGDFLHVDNAENTTTNGTRQDVACRHPSMLRIGGAVLRYCIDKMATKFKTVRVVNAAGNHDSSSAIALSMFLEGIYENCPRVIVEPTNGKFYFHEWGVNLIGITHGDRIPAPRLASVMTRLAAEAWGRTTHRRWWVGHIHHKQMLEMDVGCRIESFNTLAGTDKWHMDSGYGAERSISMILLHKDYGEIGRFNPSLELVKAYAA